MKPLIKLIVDVCCDPVTDWLYCYCWLLSSPLLEIYILLVTCNCVSVQAPGLLFAHGCLVSMDTVD